MKVSIITAFYHGNDYMKQYTDCILANQKHMSKDDELEVILANDSPDEEIKLPIDGTDYNITIVDQKENQGIHGARVRGLKEAKGEYVMFIDQDDILAEASALSYTAYRIKKGDMITVVYYHDRHYEKVTGKVSAIVPEARYIKIVQREISLDDIKQIEI